MGRHFPGQTPHQYVAWDTARMTVRANTRPPAFEIGRRPLIVRISVRRPTEPAADSGTLFHHIFLYVHGHEHGIFPVRMQHPHNSFVRLLWGCAKSSGQVRSIHTPSISSQAFG